MYTQKLMAENSKSTTQFRRDMMEWKQKESMQDRKDRIVMNLVRIDKMSYAEAYAKVFDI